MASLAATKRGGQANPFILTPENEAVMLKAFANKPEKLRRLQHRIHQYKSGELRLKSLESQRDALLKRNAELEKAGMETEEANAEAEKQKEVAAAPPPPVPPPFTPSSPTTAPSPSKRKKSSTPESPKATRKSSVSNGAEVLTRSVADDLEESSINTSSVPVPETWGSSESPYNYRGPSVKGIITPVFSDGLLFRIISASGNWLFYNDTRYYEMQVVYTLDPKSMISAGPKTRLTKLANGAWEARLSLFPEETEILVSGTVAGFENKSKAVLLPNTFENTVDLSALYSSSVAELEAIVRAASNSKLTVLKDDASARCPELSTADALDICLEHNIAFVDPQFSPSHASLYARDRDAVFIPPLHWRTPASFLPEDAVGEIRLFRGPIVPYAVKQGPLFSNYNLLSAVAIVSEYPALLRTLFSHPESPEIGARERRLGAYRVMLCFTGWWKSVVVDHYLPSTMYQPEFSRYALDLRQMWVPILEKVFAKLLSSYSSVLSISLDTALTSLTGAPVVSLESLWPATTAAGTGGKSASALAKLIKEHFENKRGIVVLKTFPLSTTKSKDKRDLLEEAYKDLGLSAGYSVAAVDLDVVNNGEHVLLRLRQSPSRGVAAPDWGAVWKEMKKPWAEAAQDLAYGLSDTQSLWMDVNDVGQYFKEGYLMYDVQNRHSSRVRGSFSRSSGGAPNTSLLVSVKRKCDIIVTLTRDDSGRCEGMSRQKSITSMLNDTDNTVFPMSLLVSCSNVGGSQRRASGPGPRSSPTLLQCSGLPDIYACNQTLKNSYAQQVSCAVTLSREQGPFYIIPRLSGESLQHDVPYVIAVFAKHDDSQMDSVLINAVKISETAPVFSRTFNGKGTLFDPSKDVKETTKAATQIFEM